jgi:hypothetical protein
MRKRLDRVARSDFGVSYPGDRAYTNNTVAHEMAGTVRKLRDVVGKGQPERTKGAQRGSSRRRLLPIEQPDPRGVPICELYTGLF